MPGPPGVANSTHRAIPDVQPACARNPSRCTAELCMAGQDLGTAGQYLTCGELIVEFDPSSPVFQLHRGGKLVMSSTTALTDKASL
jgi:hypothetical protein